jgi:hypothetical protein
MENGWVEVDHKNRKVRRSFPKQHKIGQFLKTPVYKKLVEKGWLPQTKLLKSDNKLEWYAVRYVDFVTRPNEWSTTQKLDAVRMTVDLQIALMSNNHFISYPHLGNVTFDPQPIMIDIGDIRHLDDLKTSQEVLHYYWHSFPEYKIRVKNWDQIKDKLVNLCKNCPKADLLARVKHIRDLLATAIPADHSGSWSDYRNITPQVTKQEWAEFAKKENKSGTIWRVLNEKKPNTLIDFGAYRGLYSFMADSLDIKVLGMELCEDAAADAYKASLARGAGCCFSVVDLLNLPKPLGKGGAYRDIKDRISAEAGIVPAVTHHLSRKKGFEYQAKLFNHFVKDWLLVEFVSKADVHVATWGMGAWYTEENFRKALGVYWPKITSYDSAPSPRKWLLCER